MTRRLRIYGRRPNRPLPSSGISRSHAMRCFAPDHLRSSYQVPLSLLWFEPAADRLPGTSCGYVRICATLDAQRGSERGGENSMNDDARIDKSRGNDAQLGLGRSKSPNFNIYYSGRITSINTNPRIVCLMPLRPRLQWLLNPTSSASPDSRTWLLCSIGFPGLTSTDTGSRLLPT
jgi:hypothetical protein